MDSHIKNVIDAELQNRVQILMDEIISSGKIKGKYSSDPELTVAQWIEKEFSSKKSDITNAIGKMVKTHVAELEKRYDLLFATQLITKMKEAGFMKEDIEKLVDVGSRTELLKD